jgi:lysophospholipase L1-like esterase
MKKFLALALAAILCLSAIACTGDNGDANSTTGDVTTADVTTAGDPATTTPEENKVVFVPRSDDDKIKEGNFVKVADVGASYIQQNKNGKVTLKWQTPQIEIGGIPDPETNGGQFYRMDYALSLTEGGNYYKNHMNNNIQNNNWHTSGGTIRFRTTSKTMTIMAMMHHATGAGERFTGRGMAGFDVYTGTGTDRLYLGGRMQTFTSTSMMTETVTLPAGVDGYNEVLINMPLYSGISNILITLEADALIAEPLDRDFDKPILFYGSSITQGACASRPGVAFPNMVCRMLNADCRNLGYSSGAKGEDATIAYIAKQEMVAFVMDYDHNADVNQLNATHYKLYKAVREAQPDLPIIMVSRPIFTPDYANTSFDEDEQRIKIIESTYKKAKATGDKNVYFINGYEDFFPMQAEMADLYSSDMRHPNDTGMYYMGLAIYEVLAPVLEAQKG